MEGLRRSLLLVAGLMLSAGASAQISGSAVLWGRQGESCRTPPGEARPWLNRAYSPECRARFALRQFRTVEEKLLYLDPQRSSPGGDKPTRAAPVRDVAAVLGLPEVQASDGPAGVTRGATATAFPSPLAMAATFDPAAAARYGDLIGGEFRAAGFATMLGPALDIARTWRFGRLSESFGEDPFLVGQIAAGEIRAIQARGVLVTMKHYAAYAQEAGRVGDQPSGARPAVNNAVSERALREIYLPGFEAAVKVGGAGAVMCSFPRVNGVYACENQHLLDILKREWRFDGFVVPDFPSAQRSITRAVLAGLDGGSARPTPVNAALAAEKPLPQAVADGEVPEARIDDMILRRLIPGFRVGIYEAPATRRGDDVSTADTRAAAVELLTQGSVLLKNDRGILPFGPLVRSIAVIGAQATERAVVVEQGSPYVRPAHLAPALAAIRVRAGSAVAVRAAPGTLGLGELPAAPPGLFRTRGAPGFAADYFADPRLGAAGPPLASRTAAWPSLTRAPDGIGLPKDNLWSVRYTAMLTPATTGTHKFSLHGSGSARLFVDGRLHGAFELADFGSSAFANVALVAGIPVEVRIDYSPRAALRSERMAMFGMNMGLTLQFGYAPPDTLIADAAAAARQADIALVFAGERVGEGMDRATLALQNDQDALIAAVAAANPRTVVVLNTGGPVAMPWLGKVAAVLEMWMPGDALGPAVAAMLFGDREPGGRLPVTFPRDEAQGPAHQRSEFPGTTDPRTGALDTAYFDEGVFVGYRFFDHFAQEPLFPFGHGLGYARFTLGEPTIAKDADGGAAVRVRVRNVSKRAGAEVVQVYVGLPAAAGAPPRQLAGFARVTLGAGEERTVAIRLGAEAFRSWDEDRAAWRTFPGTYRISVGRSSRDLVWTGSYEVREPETSAR